MLDSIKNLISNINTNAYFYFSWSYFYSAGYFSCKNLYRKFGNESNKYIFGF